MKLRLKNTPEQVELIKALGSKDKNVANAASTAFAAFVGPVISKVIAQASTASTIYTDLNYDEDDSPSYPLDLYYNEGENYVTVWSQNLAGGLPTSQVEGAGEMKISTYRLDSAVSWLNRYARKSRLDVVSKALERMAQEVLVKQERNAWAVILRALTNSSTAGLNTHGNRHIIASQNKTQFVVDDLSRLMTLMRRLSSSWANGTPVGADSYGLTDLYVSPEVKAQIRGFAYNPMNTLNTAGGVLGLPDSVREDIFRAAGTQELWGVRITDLLELGLGKKYNVLANAEGVKPASNFAIGHNATNGSAQGGTFDSSVEELVIGVDASRDAFIHPIAMQSESGGTFTVVPDDQFVSRSDKTGFYGFLEEGRVCIDARAVVGMVV